MGVTVCVYSHRHGEDVWVFDSPATAYQIVATQYVNPQLDDELPGIDRMAERAAISGMIERGEYEAAVYAYNEANTNRSDVERFEFYDSEVRSLPTPQVGCRCPNCGQTNFEEFEITETYTAYHPIVGVAGSGGSGPCLNVESALSTPIPSAHFNDGSEDYGVHCRACQHNGTIAEFNLPANWEWV